MSKVLNDLVENRYDYRVLGEGEKITNDSRVTGMSNNTLIVGSTGCGKTGSILYPTLKELHNSSIILSDTKGQLYKLFKAELEKKGYEVSRISLINWEQSSGYNPLHYIRRNSDGSVRYQDVITLSQSIIAANQSNEPIWELSAQQILQFLIGYTLEALPEEDHTMITVCKLYHTLTQKNGLDAFMPWVEKHPDSFPARKFDSIKSNSIADKMIASIYGFVNVAITGFEMKESKFIFDNEKSVDLRQLGNKKMALFIEISDTDHTFDSIQNIIFTQCMSVLFQEADKNDDGRLKVPVTMMMDDFAASINIPDFDRLISVTRSRDITLIPIIQSLSQLNVLYGDNKATTIMDNCSVIVYMGGQSIKTSEIIGLRSNRSQDSVLSMPNDQEIIIVAGKKPRQVKKIKPYQYENVGMEAV